jgi:hypothetical protein
MIVQRDGNSSEHYRVATTEPLGNKIEAGISDGLSGVFSVMWKWSYRKRFIEQTKN